MKKKLFPLENNTERNEKKTNNCKHALEFDRQSSIYTLNVCTSVSA